MREITTNLALFIAFCIVFSSFTACTETNSNAANTAGANATANADSVANTNKSSMYPKLASGLADADMELLDGTTFKVSDRKGKVLLLNIWGTWCGPCRAEMPHLIALQDRYRDQGFEVLGLNIGDGNGTPETVEQIKAFVASMKLNYTIARIQNSTTNQFYQISKQQVVPQTLLIDREGHLRGVFVGGGPKIIESMNATLEKAMAE